MLCPFKITTVMIQSKYNVEIRSESLVNRREDESDNMIYHGDSGKDEDLDNDDDNDNDNDYFEIQEHEDDDADQDLYYRDRNSNRELSSSQSNVRSIPEPRAMMQRSIKNVPHQSEQNVPNANSQALSLYHTDEYQRSRDLYETWMYQQSMLAVQPAAVTATDLALTRLEATHTLELHSVLQTASVVIICAFLSYVSVSPRSLPLIEYNKAYKDGLLRVFCSLIWPSVILSQLSSSTLNINHTIGNFMKSFIVGYSSLVSIELMVVTAMRMIVLGYVRCKECSAALINVLKHCYKLNDQLFTVHAMPCHAMPCLALPCLTYSQHTILVLLHLLFL